MIFLIQFYRIRGTDGARAVLAQQTVEAGDLEQAIQMAGHLLARLDMPQEPDAVAILDEAKAELCFHQFDREVPVPSQDGRPS